MKQKLLNSFTWRGTLLVALLSCAFSSAWADWKDVNNLETKTLTFTNNSTSVTSDEITWTISSNVSLQYDSEDPAIYVQKTKGTDPQYINLTTSTNPIKGTITKITVNCKSSGSSNVPPAINVSVNSQSFGSGSASNTYSDHVFTGVAYCNQNLISVTIGTSGKSIKNGNIYVKSIVITYMPCAEIPINSACYDVDVENNKRYYGTYSNPEAFVIPEGLTVHTVSVNENGALTVPNITSGIVPAGAGVMVSSSSAGDKTIFLTPNAGTINTTDNMLRPQTQVMEQTGYNFYYLTMNDNQIGFYRQNANGSLTFPANVTNKAYLAVPTSTYNPNPSSGEEVKGFAFGDGTNGIKAVETTETESKAIYNLAGQRVSKMQKGIYVVNGKKMIRR